ncbi:unnamed protein product [Durusdinium trenchii]|uniref:Uncharacterized protein n=1 Tax=Durusdinium trenchii TaxID=1381693 RepID=A0ABP0RBV4_9DINO
MNMCDKIVLFLGALMSSSLFAFHHMIPSPWDLVYVVLGCLMMPAIFFLILMRHVPHKSEEKYHVSRVWARTAYDADIAHRTLAISRVRIAGTKGGKGMIQDVGLIGEQCCDLNWTGVRHELALVTWTRTLLEDEIEKYTNGQAAYAWVISRPRILVRPLAVRRAQSSINWVKLDDGSIQELQQRAAYDGSAAMAAAIRSDMAQVERQRRRPGRRRSSSARERLVAGLMAEADDFWSEGDGVVNEVTASMQIFQNLCAWLLYGPKPPMKLMRKLLLQSARGLNEQLLKLRSPEEADKVQQLRWCFELYHRLESLPRPLAELRKTQR